MDTASGVRLRIVQRGAGPPRLMLLHGIGGHSGQWDLVCARLPADLTNVAWDARGYGGSVGPDVTAFSDFADDLLAVIDALKAAPVLAVGHSMGGRILIEAALARPEAFAGLLLSGAQPAYLAHLGAEARAGYVARRLAMFEGGRVQPAKALEVAREVLPSGAPDALVASLAADFERLRPQGYGAALRVSAGWDRRADLSRLGLPVEVVGGALDPVCPPAETLALAAALGTDRVTVLDGVAHMMQLEAPDVMAAHIAGFAARHGVRGAAA